MPAEIRTFSRPVKRIAVIGAGPTGLIAAKNLAQEGEFDVIVFERNNTIGGIWNYSTKQGPAIQFPQVSAGQYDTHGNPIPSPMYESLRTNIFYDIMEVQGHQFPDQTVPFPGHAEVLEYLKTYAEKFDLIKLISFNTSVSSARWDKSTAQWSLDLATNQDNQSSTRTELFDAVVVCNGHHTVPHIPKIAGLSEAATAFPETFMHTREYKAAEPFRGKSVLLIGAQPSGVDIAHDLVQHPDIEVSLSIREIPGRPLRDYKTFNSKITRRPEVDRFDATAREVHFVDGTVIPFPDHIIFATGYFYSYPFFRNNQLAGSPTEEEVTDGFHVKSLYKHLFYIPNPTLCFVSLQNIASPFYIADYQGKTIAKVFSGKVPLPKEAEMQESYLADIKGKPGPLYHIIGVGQIDYCEQLSNWIGNAIPPPSEKWRQRNFEINDIVLERLGFKLPLTFHS
ncbi:FAD/NAD(P)-binding domain-containing protein [Basidiobolus meristosporus CBS 931.73]|uniref:FAD/NAD(P)-binding domain-containing protein n=1 Tax=Basidiobolus meristosporus CBS 931.73 TaxID=1314790 RepID=A0A1Y1Z7M3_9FUNG|nr:FAD/NAD(P)-binding domain-containing protein [Basidiobolus meristosporus CBS 931.73]|eukprot:ORY06269.1 FAD/NAD(P)-binding domain-containing protein [Basidiobolus meristosporus CBS 931.73]